MTRPPAPNKARIFTVETRFQKMARRPGGLTREQAVTRAQASIDAMMPDFDNWLSSKLHAMTEAVRRVEGHAGDISLVDDAYSSCCQLRDVGTTMGFELISTISDNLCELLDAIKDGAAYHKETIECHK